MVTELAVITVTTIAYQKYSYRKDHKEEREIKEKFRDIMVSASTNSDIENDKCFEIAFIRKTKYGFDCKVAIPIGVNHEKLEKYKGAIEDNLKCLCALEKI